MFETWAVGEFYMRAIEKSFQKLASVKVLKKIPEAIINLFRAFLRVVVKNSYFEILFFEETKKIKKFETLRQVVDGKQKPLRSSSDFWCHRRHRQFRRR